MTIENLLRLHGHDTTKRVLPDGQLVFDPKDTPMPDQTATSLTDDELREIADTADAEMLPDETVQAMAAELLAARAEIDALRNDLDAKVSDFDAACRHLGEARERIAELEQPGGHAAFIAAQQDELRELRARVAELEAQQGEPIGYMVAHTTHDGMTSFGQPHYGDRANAEAHVARLGSAWRVIELREVSDRG